MTEPTIPPTDQAPAAGEPRPDAAPDTRERHSPELSSVVRALVEPTVRAVPVYVVRDGALVSEVVDRPVSPILTELRAEVVPSQTAAGGGGGLGAGASLEVLDELNALTSTVQEWLALVGLPDRRASITRCTSCGAPELSCRQGRDPQTGALVIGAAGMPCCSRHRHPQPDMIKDGLRRLAVHHWTGDHVRRDQLARILDYRRRNAERVLAGEVTAYYVRDTRCPWCKAEHVRDDPEPGQRPGTGLVHRPLRVERDPSPGTDGRPGPVRGTRCTACGHWVPWEAMGEDGELARAIEQDRQLSHSEAAPPGTAEAARRSVELDQRAALYGGFQTRGSARRMGLPGYGTG